MECVKAPRWGHDSEIFAILVYPKPQQLFDVFARERERFVRNGVVSCEHDGQGAWIDRYSVSYRVDQYSAIQDTKVMGKAVSHLAAMCWRYNFVRTGDFVHGVTVATDCDSRVRRTGTG